MVQYPDRGAGIVKSDLPFSFLMVKKEYFLSHNSIRLIVMLSVPFSASAVGARMSLQSE